MSASESSNERSFDQLETAVAAVARATSVEEALLSLSSALQDTYDLWSASVGVRVGEDRARIVATWSPGGTIMEAGTEVPLDLTIDLRALADTILVGRPVVFTPPSLDLGLISDVARHEGVVSTAVIPLAAGGEVVAAVTLTSGVQGAFTKADVPFLTGIGKGIEKHMLELVAPGTPT